MPMTTADLTYTIASTEVKFKELAEIDDLSALVMTFMFAHAYCCGFVLLLLLISIKMSLTLIKIKFYNLF